MREKLVEQKLTKAVNARGGICPRLTCPGKKPRPLRESLTSGRSSRSTADRDAAVESADMLWTGSAWTTSPRLVPPGLSHRKALKTLGLRLFVDRMTDKSL